MGWFGKKDQAVTVDVTGASFELDLPEHAMPFVTPGLERDDTFASGAVLAAKAKAFDDGLYAAVELAAQRGLGAIGGKAKLLERALTELGGDGDARTVVEAAAILGGVRPGGSPSAEAEVRAFLESPLRSKPLGFYTWSAELARIFRQDRMLQTDIADASDRAALAAVLEGDPTYARYLGLVEKLTNPLSCADLRPGRDGDVVAMLPPSIAHETELVKRLFGDRPIPEGFDLAKALTDAIRAGTIDLTPKAASGWYDVQTWALETLAAPERALEAKKLRLETRYREHLDALFRAILAVTRETHVNQLEMPPAGAAMRTPNKVVVRPELHVEPLPTYYLRRAESYRFVRGLLAAAFGEPALGHLQRVRASGPVGVDLRTELDSMIALFEGAAATAMRDLGLPTDRDPAPYTAWLAEEDADLAEDRRMMVPVFYDVARRKTKVWVILGWSRTWLLARFVDPPRVTSADGAPVEVELETAGFPLPSLHVAEVYVSELLDRDQFRAHCDKYRTPEAILAALR